MLRAQNCGKAADKLCCGACRFAFKMQLSSFMTRQAAALAKKPVSLDLYMNSQSPRHIRVRFSASRRVSGFFLHGEAARALVP
jgi:hypothetical protein